MVMSIREGLVIEEDLDLNFFGANRSDVHENGSGRRCSHCE
jgi:hypothetical protein